ncbi:MAG: Rrf2 family transcriptional regulator [Nevskia sp.]|nr:Rrf2 family transcriptional regulator [Nevskia sp.]
MNTRFAVATHALTFLAYAQGRWVTSEELATSINTHPALVRRMLSMLRAAGLVETQLGPGGGARLARLPERISLLEVYQAIEADDDWFAVNRLSPNPKCPLGAGIRATLECVLAKPEEALRAALGRVTIRRVFEAATQHVTPGVPVCAAGTAHKETAARKKDFG